MAISERWRQPFSFQNVAVTDAYCVNAIDKEITYLISLQEGRLLAGFYQNAGLKSPCLRYGGWESGLIGGHTLGHYLSAVSFASVNLSVGEDRRKILLRKAKNIVDGLKECQAHSQGDAGFLWGAPAARAGYAEAQFDNVEKGKTNIRKDAWVPWYTMHKILAGLIDAYEMTKYETALDVARALGDWVCRRTAKWDEKVRNRVLSVEYGGMNDCLYELYAVTGEEKYELAARAFNEERLFDKILTEGKDVLKDKHANTLIPKIIGALNGYTVTHGRSIRGQTVNAERFLRVAESFWKMVVERHTYVTGGNSEWEHFGADYVLDKRRTNCTCETCNVYNMLKLSRRLFCVTGDKRYTDYYENAFVNSILSSQNPETGMTTYFQPLAGGYFKVYSRPYDNFWCCTGTGMENFTKIGGSLYYRGGDDVYIEGYLASVLRYQEGEIRLDCDFPRSDRAEITIVRAERPFVLCLRIPDWASGEPVLLKNGKPFSAAEKNGHLRAEAEEGDCFSLVIPLTVTLKGLPDGDTLAFSYGGAVLSANLGKENMRETETGVDVAIPEKRVIATERVYFENLADVLEYPEKYMVKSGDKFYLQGGDIPLEFGYHYRKYNERYAVYFRLREGKREDDTPEWQETREASDSVQPGYGQYETDELHELQEKNSVGETEEASSRYARAGGYFSYDFAVNPAKKNILAFSLSKKDSGKPLKITAGDEVIFCGWTHYAQEEEIYTREFELSTELIGREGRRKLVGGREYTVIRIKFEGIGNRRSAKISRIIAIYN